MMLLIAVGLALAWEPLTPEGYPDASVIRSTAGNALTHQAVGAAQVAVGPEDAVFVAFAEDIGGVPVLRSRLWRDDDWVELPDLHVAIADGAPDSAGYVGPAFSLALSVELAPWLAWANPISGVSVARFGPSGWEHMPDFDGSEGPVVALALTAAGDDLVLSAAECGVGGVREATRLHQASLGASGWSDLVLKYEYANRIEPCGANMLATVGDSHQRRVVWQHWGAANHYEVFPQLVAIEPHHYLSGLISPAGDWYEPAMGSTDTSIDGMLVGPDFVASVARSAGHILVATGSVHLGSAHQRGTYNRVSVAGLVPGVDELVTTDSQGERVGRNAVWTQLPTQEPMAMLQSWKSVSVLRWSGVEWLPLGVVGENRRGLGEHYSADTRPELFARAGRLVVQWDAQSDAGSQLVESKLRRHRWSSSRALSIDIGGMETLCSGDGFWLPALRGGSGRIGTVLCDSSWDSIHGFSEQSYLTVLFDGAVLGEPLAQKQERVRGEVVDCFGLSVTERLESYWPRSCQPRSVGRFRDQPSVMARLDSHWVLATHDDEWRAMEMEQLPRSSWYLVGDADYWMRESRDGDLVYLEGWSLDGGNAARFDSSDPITSFAVRAAIEPDDNPPALQHFVGTTTNDGLRVLAWVQAYTYFERSIRIGLWIDERWVMDDRGLPQNATILEGLEVGFLPDGRPLAAWSQDGDVYVKVLTDDGWVGLDGVHSGNVSRSEDESRWPSMTMHDDRLCVAWSEADEGASQILVHCTHSWGEPL